MPPSTKDLPANLPLDTQIALLIHPERNPTGYVPFENAAAHPFQPAAPGHARVNAWWLADASWLAYLHGEEEARLHARRAGLECRLVGARQTQCCVAWNREFALVAFRGTQPDEWGDIFDDARYRPVEWGNGRVHGGFADAFERVKDALAEVLGRLPPETRVWFTGHSLGAALATLAADRFERAAGVYTFGSPLVGNQVFTGHFNARFPGRSFRYVNDHDVVTHVPPELFALPFGLYAHVNEERWIDRDGHVGSNRPTLLHFVGDVFGTPTVLLHMVSTLTTVGRGPLPAALSDHTPLYYALHAWNDFARNG